MKMTKNIAALLKGMTAFNDTVKGKYRAMLIVAPNLFAPFDMVYSFSIENAETNETVYDRLHIEETGGTADALAEMLVLIEKEKKEGEEK